MSNILTRNKIAIAVLVLVGIALVATLVGIATASIANAATYNFTRNLKVGMSGSDVMDLQKFLNESADTQVSSTGAGSPGGETSYFGAKTKAAVVKWQEKYAASVLTPVGLSSGTGYFGPSSRAFANGMVATTPTTPTTPTVPGTVPTTGGALSVAAAAQPSNGLAIVGTTGTSVGASRVPFTKVTLTAGSNDVTVSGITVERVGAAQDAVFSGVTLVDENGSQLGIAKTLNSNHQTTVGDPFVVKAGTSRTMTIAGNMTTVANGAVYAGQVVALQVNAVNTNGTVSGSLPIVGAYHTINSTLTIGTAPLQSSSYDPGSGQSKEIGTSNYKFAAIRLQAGSAEQIRVKSIRWNQTGSAGAGDLANVMTYVDGTAYPTTVSADGKYYTAVFGSGIVIDKGLGKDIYVQGDIIGTSAAGRTVIFDIYKATDINITGETYGYGITPTASGAIAVPARSGTSASAFTTGTPFFFGVQITVSSGSVTTVAKATSVAAQNVAINVPNQVLGGYEIDLKGEPISVQSSVFHFGGTVGSTNLMTNIALYGPNGNVVAGPVDAVADTGGSVQKVTFSDTITYPIGKGVYTLKGKMHTSTTNGQTVIASTTPVTDWTSVTGQTTGNTISLTALSSVVNMNTMTVKSAALSVTMGTTPVASNIVSGGTVTFANLQFDATQSGEDVRFSSIALSHTNPPTGISGCQVFDGSALLNSTALNPSAVATAETITFDQMLIVTKGTVKTLALKCNVSSAATGSYTWTMTTSVTNPTVTGVTSGTGVTATGGAVTSASLAIANGSLAVTTSPSSPSYAVAAAGSTGNTVGVIRFRATNEAVTLNRIGLKLNSTSTALSASSSASDLVQVSIWDGTAQVGSATFTSGGLYATSTLSSPVTLPKDADKDLTVKLDLAAIDSATGGTGPGTQGALIAVDVNGSDTTGTQGSGYNSGGTINASGSTAFTGVRMFKSYPTFALDTLSGNGVTDGRLMRFKVTANSRGGVGINQLKFTMSTTGATVLGVNLFGFTEGTYSSGISGFTSGQIATSNTNPGTGGAVTITPSAVINIPAGSTYYFELKGTVAGTGTAYSVNTTLSGDSAYPALASAWTQGGTGLMDLSGNLTGGSLIWSPNATTTSAALHDDWTNGYGVPGLPSSGLSFNRAQ